MSCRPFVLMYHCGCHWKNFREIGSCGPLRNSGDELYVFCKYGNDIGHFTLRPERLYVVGSGTKCSVNRQQCKGKFFVRLLQHCWFVLLTATSQQYRHNKLLRSHSNCGYVDAPQVVRALPTSLNVKSGGI